MSLVVQPHYSKMLYENYQEFTAFLLEAIETMSQDINLENITIQEPDHAEVGSRFDNRFSFFVVARTILEENDKAFVGKAYTVQISISGSIPENVHSKSLDLSIGVADTSIAFDILLHAGENVEFANRWYQHLDYITSNRDLQIVDFEFQVTASGSCFIVVDFYREFCWVRTIRLEFDAIEEP